jgi:hypothetical protein
MSNRWYWALGIMLLVLITIVGCGTKDETQKDLGHKVKASETVIFEVK